MDQLYDGEGMLQSVRLLKRGDDQRQGEVTAYVLYGCRRSIIRKSGQTLHRDMTSRHATTWHIPMEQLQAFGIKYLNPTDKIVQLEGDEAGWEWQPESTTEIRLKLLGTHLCCDCLRRDSASRRALSQ